jgi:hypothetical protein
MDIVPIEHALHESIVKTLLRIQGSPVYAMIREIRETTPNNVRLRDYWDSPLQKLERFATTRLGEGSI